MMASATPSPRRIERLWPEEISLGQGRTFGRSPGEDRHICLPDRNVAMRHCKIVRKSAGAPRRSAYWIEDLGSGRGTFVNRVSVTSHRLREADLVQIGPFAWTFSETDGYLVPAGPIEGLQVDLQKVALAKRLAPLTLTLRPGELTAVVGASGAGKSTFFKAVLAAVGSRDAGKLLFNGRNVEDDPAGYRSLLGYLSQDATLHQQLSARQAVRFAARLRGGTSSHSVTTVQRGEDAAERTLHEVDLLQSKWDTPITKLSGGERQRARLAAELVAGPRLLLLDEPTSGLDSATEKAVLRRLRGLAIRGGCIVVVTHGLSFLDLFDRVLVFGATQDPVRRPNRLAGLGRSADRAVGTQVVFDGRPAELQARIPSGEFIDLADANLTAEATTTGTGDSDSSPRPVTEEPPVLETGAFENRERLRQVPTLLRRELALLYCDWVRRLALPILVVPAAFALALWAAVPPDARHLLGFLAVLSCVWSGASLSLMAVVNERKVYDHERFLFLRIGDYLLTKTFVAWVAAAIQASVFVGVLQLLRGEQFFYFPVNAYLTLLVAGIAGSSLGLLISVGAGTSQEAANFILPLVMIAQIVFGVQVAGHGDAPLHRASDGAFKTAVGASYLTISRPADILLRTGSYWSVDAREAEHHDYARQRRFARIALVAHVIVPVAAAYLALLISPRWRLTFKSMYR